MKTGNPKVRAFMDQFSSIFDGQPWFGESISQILEGVTPATAYWQPIRTAHSIAQVISHMIYWRQTLIKRLEGDMEYKSSMKSDDNWKDNEALKKSGWQSLNDSLEDSQTQMLSLLAKQNDTLLKKKYSDKATYQALINGILQHDLYHTGQIAYLKSLYQIKNKKSPD